MPKRPVVSWKSIIRMLKKLGYNYDRQKGSHMIFYKNAPLRGSGVVSVPRHDELDPGLRDGIIEAISMHTGISEEDIVDMLR